MLTAGAPPQLEFWYEFASTYSYPCAMRIAGLASRCGVAVSWRPFLLGPILADAGFATSPFNLQPAKGRYMWRDVERTCIGLGLPFRRPDPFPQNGLLAARVATALADPLARAEFSRAVYTAEFGSGRSIADEAVLAEVLGDLGHEPPALLATARSEAVKDELRRATTTARERGIFGAPSLVTADGELFWGNDRLEQALSWAVRVAADPPSDTGVVSAAGPAAGDRPA
jgi:2-hydroxychromene-2-carboxylate isomerase